MLEHLDIGFETYDPRAKIEIPMTLLIVEVYLYQISMRHCVKIVAASLSTGFARGVVCASMESSDIMSSSSTRARIYLDHDGGNDDFVALVYMLTAQSRWVKAPSSYPKEN